MPCITSIRNEGGRDGKSSKNECNKKLPSAVVVNDHMYPRPLLYSFYDPFGSKTI